MDKTGIIFNPMTEELKYFIFDKDLSRFHNIFINTYYEDGSDEEKLEQELCKFMYDNNEENISKNVGLDFFVQEIRKDPNMKVIISGELP